MAGEEGWVVGGRTPRWICGWSSGYTVITVSPSPRPRCGQWLQHLPFRERHGGVCTGIPQAGKRPEGGLGMLGTTLKGYAACYHESETGGRSIAKQRSSERPSHPRTVLHGGMKLHDDSSFTEPFPFNFSAQTPVFLPDPSLTLPDSAATPG